MVPRYLTATYSVLGMLDFPQGINWLWGPLCTECLHTWLTHFSWKCDIQPCAYVVFACRVGFRENSNRNLNCLKPLMEMKLLSYTCIFELNDSDWCKDVEGDPQNMGYCVQVLEKLWKQVLGLRLILKCNWFLLHNSAATHSCMTVKCFLENHDLVEIRHPPFPPDLAPASFLYSFYL